MLVVALFTAATAPATGLVLADVDLYLYRRNKTTAAVDILWSPENPTTEIDAAGQYVRDYPGENLTTYDYFAYGHYTGAVVLDVDYSYPGGLPSECVSRILPATFTSLKAALHQDQIDILRGDTLDEQPFNRLGDISTRSKLWFTVKDDKDDADTGALIQIEETAGLLYINGTAGTPANGSITVTDTVQGNITVFLEAVETAKLDDKTGNLYWDIQVLTNAGIVQTLARGRAVIVGDSTRAVS